jgi:uncharacterized RDD family membrane protein YckC
MSDGNTVKQVYAGFWLRFLAWLFDIIILGLVFGVVEFVVKLTIGISIISFILSISDNFITRELGGFLAIEAITLGLLGSIILPWILCQIFGWLYYAIFESSQKQATPGKLLLSLKVTDANNQRISFGRSTLRHLLKAAFLFPAILVLVMGGLYIPIGSGTPGQNIKTLAILLALTILLSPVLFFIFYGMSGWTRKKRAFHDIGSGCYIARKAQLSPGRLWGTIVGIILLLLLAKFAVPGIWRIAKSVTINVNRVSEVD